MSQDDRRYPVCRKGWQAPRCCHVRLRSPVACFLRCRYGLTTTKAKWTWFPIFQVHDHTAYCNGAVAVVILRLEYAGEWWRQWQQSRIKDPCTRLSLSFRSGGEIGTCQDLLVGLYLRIVPAPVPSKSRFPLFRRKF
jgi:hypothetical protein